MGDLDRSALRTGQFQHRRINPCVGFRSPPFCSNFRQTVAQLPRYPKWPVKCCGCDIGVKQFPTGVPCRLKDIKLGESVINSPLPFFFSSSSPVLFSLPSLSFFFLSDISRSSLFPLFKLSESSSHRAEATFFSALFVFLAVSSMQRQDHRNSFFHVLRNVRLLRVCAAISDPSTKSGLKSYL